VLRFKHLLAEPAEANATIQMAGMETRPTILFREHISLAEAIEANAFY